MSLLHRCSSSRTRQCAPAGLHRRLQPLRALGLRALSVPPAGPVAGDGSNPLAAELDAQRKLAEASSQGMYIHYCREHSGTRLWRWLRSCSIDVSFDFRRWRKHQKASRNLILWTPKNVLRADNIRRLVVPDLLMMCGTSTLICYYNSCLAGTTLLTLPMECFSVTSAALGLLVTFKTNACYSRFDDARTQWGLLTNESRAFASRILTRVPAPRGSRGVQVMRARYQAVRLVQTFPVTLKYHLTEDGCNPHIIIRSNSTEAEIRTATNRCLRAELEQIWDMSEEDEAEIVERIMAEGGNRPLFILHELGHLNADIFHEPMQGGLHAVISTELDRSISLFQHVLGRCERILRTPIYTPYTKFTSRFLFLWCSALPLGLYPLLGPLATVPVAALTSFFLLGIQDIGSRVEQPFDVLPLWQYCQTVSQSCEQMLRQSERLHKRTPPLEEQPFWDIPEESLRSFVDPL